MFYSLEKRLNKKRVGLDVLYIIITRTSIQSRRGRPARSRTGGCQRGQVGTRVTFMRFSTSYQLSVWCRARMDVTAGVSALLLGWRATVSQDNVHIGSVDFLWIFFSFWVDCTFIPCRILCNKVCFRFHSYYLWCNWSRRFQHCLVGLRVCGFRNDAILASDRFWSLWMVLRPNSARSASVFMKTPAKSAWKEKKNKSLPQVLFYVLWSCENSTKSPYGITFEILNLRAAPLFMSQICCTFFWYNSATNLKKWWNEAMLLLGHLFMCVCVWQTDLHYQTCLHTRLLLNCDHHSSNQKREKLISKGYLYNM